MVCISDRDNLTAIYQNVLLNSKEFYKEQHQAKPFSKLFYDNCNVIYYAETRINKSLGSRQTQLAVKCPIVIDKGMPPLLAGILHT